MKRVVVTGLGIVSSLGNNKDEVKKSLAQNNNMYADVEGLGGKEGIRLHQHLFDKDIMGTGGNSIKHGQFYVLFDSKFDDPNSDPNIGSPEYHPSAKNIKRRGFNSIEEFYAFTKNKYEGSVLGAEKLKTEYDVLLNNPTMEPSRLYDKDHPFIKKGLTREQIIKELSVLIGVSVTGNNSTPTSQSTGTINFQ